MDSDSATAAETKEKPKTVTLICNGEERKIPTQVAIDDEFHTLAKEIIQRASQKYCVLTLI